MASSSESSLPMATLIHMLTIKLSSSNYLLWKNQVSPLLLHQNWLRFVDGSYQAPSKTLTTDGKKSVNPAFTSWLETDQKILLLLQSSLSEEAMSEVLGLSSSREVWQALESAYSHDSMERSQNLKDSLRKLKKGTASVADYAKQFKNICDKLAAIGQPVSESDKTHWFLCGLGPSFETFSTAQRVVQPRLLFRDLLAQAEGHELFVASLHSSNPSPIAFAAQKQNSSHGKGKSGRFSHRDLSSSKGRPRRPPHCQLCRREGHYANSCPDLGSFAQKSSYSAANLAQAFHANCNLNDSTPDWYVDSGATAHMAPSTTTMDSSVPYTGNDKVSFGNGLSNQGHSSQRTT